VTEPAVLRRRLTAELRRLRSQTKLTQQQVAERLDWSLSKVIRIEQGKVKVRVTDLEALVRLYGVDDQTAVDDLTALARGSKKLPFAEYRDVVSQETIRYFGYEANASTVRQFALNVIPGILQTDEYARAIFDTYQVPPEQAEKLLQSRRDRRTLLDRAEPPALFVVIDEAALRRTIGGADVMARQIDHLVALAGRPNISIQGLPFALGAHAGLRGSFIHLEFAGDDEPDVIFIENAFGDLLYREDLDLTATYLDRFWELERQSTRRDDFEKFAKA
jgi:transcriptional regulator with XRE-family HTH domain